MGERLIQTIRKGTVLASVDATPLAAGQSVGATRSAAAAGSAPPIDTTNQPSWFAGSAPDISRAGYCHACTSVPTRGGPAIEPAGRAAFETRAVLALAEPCIRARPSMAEVRSAAAAPGAASMCHPPRRSQQPLTNDGLPWWTRQGLRSKVMRRLLQTVIGRTITMLKPDATPPTSGRRFFVRRGGLPVA